MTNNNDIEEIKTDKCKENKGRLRRFFCYVMSAFEKYPISDDTCYGIYCY